MRTTPARQVIVIISRGRVAASRGDGWAGLGGRLSAIPGWAGQL